MACVKYRRRRWVVDFYDQDGKRRWATYETREKADAALSELVPAVRQGTYRPPAELPTLAVVARDWFASKSGRRVSTQAGWQVHLDQHIVPALGRYRIDQIRVADVDTFREKRQASGLAPQTVNKLLTTLSAVFTFAMQRELITRNPAAVADRCHLNAAEVALHELPESATDMDDDDGAANPQNVLSTDEARRLVEAAPEGFGKTFLLAAVLTGARVGELTALTWNDINFRANRLHIRRSISWAKLRGQPKSEPRFYPPKTEAGTRTIKLSPELAHALKVSKLACPPGPKNLVFPNLDGSPRHRTTITYGVLRPALQAAGLRQATLHSLRHTCASILILSGLIPWRWRSFSGTPSRR